MARQERVILSFIGGRDGMSVKDAKEMLDANGISDVKTAHSVYIGHNAVSVLAKQQGKAMRILFGR